MQRKWCPNLNHRRADAPVRYCPNCGEVVSANIIVKKCSEEEHVESRRRRNTYCMDCGAQLIK
ncbi:MAG: hypothetical protein XU15_C0003G0179 [candidate division NC10 bacterium CSP1-5]|nr:MAG: hypothetical protein XU15_C0003G0179 [candidate division NC10 bacterium CSP1-5]